MIIYNWAAPTTAVAWQSTYTGHMNSEPIRSRSTPRSASVGKNSTTIEGLSAKGLHPVQKAWIAPDVPQFGYVESSQIVSAVALLSKNKQPSDADAEPISDKNVRNRHWRWSG